MTLHLILDQLQEKNRVQPGHQVMIEHRSENLLRAPILTYSRQQLMDLKRQRCFPLFNSYRSFETMRYF